MTISMLRMLFSLFSLLQAIRKNDVLGLRLADECYGRLMRGIVEIPETVVWKSGGNRTTSERVIVNLAMDNAIEAHKKLREK